MHVYHFTFVLLKRWRDRAGLLGSPGCLSRLSCFSISHYCSPWPSGPPSMANIVRILFREVKFLIAFQTNIFSRYFLIKKIISNQALFSPDISWNFEKLVGKYSFGCFDNSSYLSGAASTTRNRYKTCL